MDINQSIAINIGLGKAANRHTGIAHQFQLTVGWPAGHGIEHVTTAVGTGIQQLAGGNGVRATLQDGTTRIVDNGRRTIQYRQPVALGLFVHNQMGINPAGLVFEFPVTTKRSMAGKVVAGGNVSAGQRLKCAQQCLPFTTRGQITAIEQQVSTGIKRLAPGCNGVLVALQGCVIQPAVTQ